MKLILALLAVLLPAVALAQGGGPTIQAKTFIRDDGSRVEIVKNLEERTSEQKVYGSNGKLAQRTVFNLDEDGREIGGSVYNAKDVLQYTFTYKLDENGRILEQSNFSPDEKLLQRMVYRYRPNGQQEVDVYDAEGKLINPPKGGSKSKSGRGR